MSEPLRLLAEDADDLAVLSAAAQDSVLVVGDIRFEPKARRVSLQMNRFRWEGGRRERVRAALAFENVMSVKSLKLRQDAGDAVAALLAITFAPAAEPPGGEVSLAFAGGGVLKLEVEALEARLLDVSAPWPTKHKPSHETEGA